MTTVEPPQQDQPVSDDQELANVLAGMQEQNQALVQDPPAPAGDAPAMQYEEINSDQATPAEPAPADAPAPEPAAAPSTPAASGEFDDIKRQALEELRPLATKLDLPADEKFDALLLIIRSTDDKSLISAAHDAAKAIEDEEKRAQALFDIVKEIDYFSAGQPKPES